jgi:hypothetical protein
MLLGILVVVFGLTTYVEAQAQCDVILPQLNLTGDLSGYNTAWYPVAEFGFRLHQHRSVNSFCQYL